MAEASGGIRRHDGGMAEAWRRHRWRHGTQLLQSFGGIGGMFSESQGFHVRARARARKENLI
jgi:uncharacterized protein (DUF779 family)